MPKVTLLIKLEAPIETRRNLTLQLFFFRGPPGDVNIVVARSCRNNKVSHGLLSQIEPGSGSRELRKAVDLFLHLKTEEKTWTRDSASKQRLRLHKTKVPMTQAFTAPVLRTLFLIGQVLKGNLVERL